MVSIQVSTISLLLTQGYRQQLLIYYRVKEESELKKFTELKVRYQISYLLAKNLLLKFLELPIPES